MKVVINRRYGGFGLSDEALELYKKIKNISGNVYDFQIERNDTSLIEVVETLKDKANDAHSKLRIIEIPDDIEWEIDDYDGMETIHEVHRSWY